MSYKKNSNNINYNKLSSADFSIVETTSTGYHLLSKELCKQITFLSVWLVIFVMLSGVQLRLMRQRKCISAVVSCC